MPYETKVISDFRVSPSTLPVILIKKNYIKRFCVSFHNCKYMPSALYKDLCHPQIIQERCAPRTERRIGYYNTYIGM
jgi:hypothetical protein